MDIKRVISTVTILTILSCNIGCDQITKNIVRKRIAYDEQISLLDNYITLTKIENSGAFLSLGASLPKLAKVLLLTMLPLTLMCVAVFYLVTKVSLSRHKIWAICFIIGGGIGNIYDRIVYGSVTDFLHIDFGLFQTGIFNMADVSIMTGIFIVLLDSFYSSLKPNGESTRVSG